MKRYTAQEMRVRADYEESANANTKTAAMLRQAADVLEREKKYEYAVMYEDGEVSGLHYLDIEPLKHGLHANHRTVRREVGDWEEVSE